ncbi:hypothetical protein HBH98_182210 [Parastagonospora nodorum]|nr:hypothetical protein HBH98_182210 [Parastagonospora nodorum]KAH5084604.1 hypothetical protein HBI73_155210 [Parastagonospora nodorum]KAH5089214.1 hypothetical protein HBH72_232630 [Parastagonospora nodorum]KAH5099176.1 hypothetical protein HBH71_235760 [Parastagonospora nodorum]KAH5395989.1 hypothetical protein HBI47_227950 [Parastagonospora nodorum]
MRKENIFLLSASAPTVSLLLVETFDARRRRRRVWGGASPSLSVVPKDWAGLDICDDIVPSHFVGRHCRRRLSEANLPREFRTSSALAPRCAHHTHRRDLLLARQAMGSVVMHSLRRVAAGMRGEFLEPEKTPEPEEDEASAKKSPMPTHARLHEGRDEPAVGGKSLYRVDGSRKAGQRGQVVALRNVPGCNLATCKLIVAPIASSLTGIPPLLAVQELAYRQGQKDHGVSQVDVPASPFTKQFDQIWSEFYTLGKACGGKPISPSNIDSSSTQQNFPWPVLVNPYTQDLEHPNGSVDAEYAR